MLLPRSTVPPEVLLNVKLLIVVLPDKVNVPKAPVPPIEIFDAEVVSKELPLGVNVPFIVRVLDPTERLPASKIIVPTMTRFADNETPEELLILVVIPDPVG